MTGSGYFFPVLMLIFALSAFIALGFSRGKNKNKRIYLSAFHDLTEVFKPDDQTFTNIGGYVGHHATFCFQERECVCEIDATITLLPRHAPLYMPISKLIMRNDKLFVSLYMRYAPPGEGHLIETEYARFRGPKITNAYRMSREKIQWGNYSFYLYYESIKLHDLFMKLTESHSDPGVVRHIAINHDQRKAFIFMIPQEGHVAKSLSPVYQWFQSVFSR